MNWCAAIESVAGVGVSHPVRRGFLFQSRAFPGRIHDSPQLRNVEVPAFPTAKEGIGSRCPVAQLH